MNNLPLSEGRAMDRAERIAKVVLEALLPGARMEYRADQSQSVYDFDLRLGDGSVAAVEVTTSTDRTLEATLAAIEDDRKGGERIAARQCQKDWWIHPSKRASVNRIRADADAYLAEVEREGLSQFFFHRDAPDYESVRRIWRELGIEAGSVLQWKDGPAIRIARPGQRTIVRPENVTRAVLREANKDENVKKLRASGAVETQLFVYISPYSYAAWTAINEEALPAHPTLLPDGIDQAWAAADSREGDIVVWSLRSGKLWRDCPRVSSSAVGLGR